MELSTSMVATESKDGGLGTESVAIVLTKGCARKASRTRSSQKVVETAITRACPLLWAMYSKVHTTFSILHRVRAALI